MLRRRLILLMLCVTLSPMLGGLVVLVRSASNQLHATAEERLAISAAALNERVVSWVDNIIPDLLYISREPRLATMDPREHRALLLNVLKSYPNLTYVHTIGADGINVARGDNLPLMNFSDRDYFKRVMSGEALVHETLLSSRSTGRPSLNHAAPIRGTDGRVLGMIVFGIDLRDLSAVVGMAHLGKTGYSFVIDEAGNPLAHSDADVVFQARTLKSLPPVHDILRDHKAGASRFQDAQGRWWLAHTTLIRNGWSVVCVQAESEVLAAAHRIALLGLLVMACTAPLMTVLTWMVSRRILHPILQMTAAAHQITNGRRTLRIPALSSDELGTLAMAFNQMLDDLDRAYRSVEETVVERTKEMKKLLRAVEQSPATVIITDATGTIEYVNPKFTEITGYTAKEAIGKNPRILQSGLLPPDVYVDLWKTITSGGTWRGELHNRKKNGQTHWESASISPLLDESNRITHFIAVKEDITERKRADEELRQMNRDLQQAITQAKEMTTRAEVANNAKSDFLANMSHEIRTPMTAILGFAERLLEEDNIDGAPPARLKAINTIIRNGEHLLALINNILDFSKIEAGRLEIETVRCSPLQIVNEVCSMLSVAAEAKGLSLKLECPGSFPETILADPTRLRQILLNLTNNAIKFTQGGCVRIAMNLVIGNDGVSQLCFDIIDTGIGISNEQIARLFQPFVQADSTTARQFGGSGLGLVISRRLAELLSGNVSIVETTPGKGTRIRVSIPTGPLEGVQIRPGTTVMVDPEDLDPIPLPGVRYHLHARILLAEDCQDNRELISQVLRNAGASVIAVNDGKAAAIAALNACKQGMPFDIILMDMQMPVLDGYQATRLLRGSGYRGPIIALTAHAIASDRAKCLQAGCTDHATKPINRRALFATLAPYVPESNSAPAAARVASGASEAWSGAPFPAALIQQFVDRLSGRVDAIEEALQHRDLDALSMQAHKLKGIAGTYGFHQLTDCAIQLEHSAGGNSDFETISAQANELVGLCRQIQCGADPPAAAAPVHRAGTETCTAPRAHTP